MMFEPSGKPRLFALPPGVDFPAELIKGLDARLAGQSPEALSRVQLIVNTRRMERRIREIYDTGPARLLPRLKAGRSALSSSGRRRLKLFFSVQ